jgi:hypothetical protein
MRVGASPIASVAKLIYADHGYSVGRAPLNAS